MPYWRCYYHLVWATKNRVPSISLAFEKVLFECLAKRASLLHCTLIAVNSAFDHVHLAMSVPPSRSVSSVMGQLKGESSHILNDTFAPPDKFLWQESFGALTVSEKSLPVVINYIANQKQHHAEGTLYRSLEATE